MIFCGNISVGSEHLDVLHTWYNTVFVFSVRTWKLTYVATISTIQYLPKAVQVVV